MHFLAQKKITHPPTHSSNQITSGMSKLSICAPINNAAQKISTARRGDPSFSRLGRYREGGTSEPQGKMCKKI